MRAAMDDRRDRIEKRERSSPVSRADCLGQAR